MKKKLIIVFAIIAVVLLLIPVKKVYDGNGDEILTYTAGVGWYEKEAEPEVRDEEPADHEKIVMAVINTVKSCDNT